MSEVWTGGSKIQVNDKELAALIDTEIERGGRSYNTFAYRLRSAGVRVGLPRVRRIWIEREGTIHPYNTFT